MLHALIVMMLVLLIGIALAVLRPGNLDVPMVRRAITTLVYNLMLPALIISVMWDAPVGADSVRLAVAAVAGVLLMTALTLGLTRIFTLPSTTAAAAMLAAAYPNATYLGLPVLEASFGQWARSIAIQYDLLACTPLLLTLGIYIAQRYSTSNSEKFQPLISLLRVPPLWAMVFALFINFADIQLPAIVLGVTDMLGACVVPLMLLSLGMSLRWQAGMQGNRRWLVIIVVLQLFIHPALVLLVAHTTGLQGQMLAATVMESAMPCMVLGIVICDRYNLDTAFYAAAVTASTVLSVVTLPLWLHWLIGWFVAA